MPSSRCTIRVKDFLQIVLFIDTIIFEGMMYFAVIFVDQMIAREVSAIATAIV
jgi:hypothetical protein